MSDLDAAINIENSFMPWFAKGQSVQEVADMIDETDLLVLYADATFNFDDPESFAKARDMPIALAHYIIDLFDSP